MKFTLYDFLGQPKAFYFVDQETTKGNGSVKKQVGHLIFVCDASGSMYGDMDALRSMTEKLLTLEEYRDSGMLASVLSFSSQGDLITHVNRKTVGEIMKPGSAHVEEIRKLRTRGLTCISQGLEGALKLIKPEEPTAVVLLSDGFANDRSPGSEKRALDTLVEQYRKLPGVFVHTIAFRTWADFKLLSFVANAASGTCFQTPTVKEVYDVLHQTTDLLVGSVAPAIELKLKDADYQVAVSSAARKVMGGSTDLLVRGLNGSDDLTVYRFKRVEQPKWDAATVPVCGEDNTTLAPVLAFAKAQLAEGYVNAAKYALCTTRNQTLLGKHARALVNGEIAAMAADIELAMFNGTDAHTMSKSYGLPNATETSVLGILNVLSDFGGDLEVDLTHLKNGYKRRGVKRIAGVREGDGSVTKPWVKTAFREPDAVWAKVGSFDVNRNNATVNMLVLRGINLVKADDNAVINEVAGIKLDLSAFNNYTLVGDGTLNVGELRFRLGNKRLHRALVDAKALPDTSYDPKGSYTVTLAGRPLIAYNATFDAAVFDGLFEKVAAMKALSSILTASMKAQSDQYTEDQVVELKKHYLSTALYVSLPTTNEYADLQKALADGIIDTRLSYKVDFGTPDILNLGELYSANEFLGRHFSLTRGGVEEKKPKFDMRWDNPIYGYKTLSARTKINAVDTLMKPLFEEFLGLKSTGAVGLALAAAGVSDTDVKLFMAARTGTTSKDTAVERFTDARKALDGAIDRLFRERLSQVVFFIGATGLVPDEFNTRAWTADQAKEKFPNLSIGKDEAEGTFYDVGGTLLVVYVKPEYFSTGKVPPTDEEEAA